MARRRRRKYQKPTIPNDQTQDVENQHIPVSMQDQHMVLDNDDLLKEILLRLPAKSLIRSKAVSKTWRFIIMSDQFCHQHTLRHPKLQPSLLLNMNGDDQFSYFDPTRNGEKKTIPYRRSVYRKSSILQACNGLMLLDPLQYNRYCIYNPTTKQSRVITFPHNEEYPRDAGMGLAFDPSKSPYYKIVCIKSTARTSADCSFTYQIEVYDSESHTWKLSLEALTSPVPRCLCGTYWNNGIYWWWWSSTGTTNDEGYCWFDIGKNEMKRLLCPQTPFYGSMHLQESNGHLYHYVFDYEPQFDYESQVAVWELQRNDDQCDEWIFKYRVAFNSGIKVLRFIEGSDGDGDGETCSVLISWEGKMRAYNFLHKTYEDLIDYAPQPSLDPLAHHFGETLAWV